MMVIKWDEPADRHSQPPKIRAAQYVRMSTEHQQFSTDNQVVAIARYADDNSYEIVRTYAHEGKSGLNLGGRAGLQEILKDVEESSADFKALLVYDVSRLGRFQDTDEAATNELRLRSAGIEVQYASEQFRNDIPLDLPNRENCPSPFYVNLGYLSMCLGTMERLSCPKLT